MEWPGDLLDCTSTWRKEILRYNHVCGAGKYLYEDINLKLAPPLVRLHDRMILERVIVAQVRGVRSRFSRRDILGCTAAEKLEVFIRRRGR
jgi:hypothetical protein